MRSRSIAFFIMAALILIVRQYPFPLGESGIGGMAVALGGVILAAYLAGEILSRLRLPRISGYLFTGMALGPYIGGFLTNDMIRDFSLIDQIALALIALSAGGELRFASIRQRWRGIAYITLAQTISLFLAGAAVFFVIIHWLPFLSSLSFRGRLAASAIFGVISVAQSPSSTIAVITETRSSGKATEAILGVAVVKDVLVIVLFTALIPLVKISEQGGSFEWGFLGELAEELVFSCGAGLLAGWMISQYLKMIRIDAILFVLAFCYLVSEGSKTLHLDTLIICIIAGFWVTNASKQGKDLIETIENSSLIVYVIFFCIAGASLNLAALALAWAATIVLVLARMLAMAGSTWIGIRLSRDIYPSASSLWTAFLAQAGVSLGLVTILQREGISWGADLKTIVVTVIAVNQIVGPIALKFALQRSGETGKHRR
ncbi:MAG: cation:proton antiporter [Candidatus Omnitrophota bacterium]